MTSREAPPRSGPTSRTRRRPRTSRRSGSSRRAMSRLATSSPTRTRADKAVVNAEYFNDVDAEDHDAGIYVLRSSRRTSRASGRRSSCGGCRCCSRSCMFFLFMRQLQAGGGKAMSFGKSQGASCSTDTQNKVTFADVAGVDEAKDEVEEIIAFLKDPKKFTAPRRPHPQGRADDGPAGHRQDAARARHRRRGRRAVLQHLGLGLRRDVRRRRREPRARPLRAGQEARALHHLHRRDRRRRSSPRRRPRRRSRRARADAEPAPRRDGRLRVERRRHHHRRDQPPRRARPGASCAPAASTAASSCRAPTCAAARASSASTPSKVPLAPDVDLDDHRARHAGLLGADLENLVNEAALLAARQDKDAVDDARLRDGQGQGPHGRRAHARWSSRDEEKRTTAVHEAGHALVAELLATHHDPVHKVTIIPRGPALGVTQQLPKEDRLSLLEGAGREPASPSALGGRIAEEIVFGQLTTGAGNDIEKATDLARKMVCEWGMSEKLGPLTFSGGKDEVFLGRDFSSSDRLLRGHRAADRRRDPRHRDGAAPARHRDPDRAPQGARGDRRGAARVRDHRRSGHRHVAPRRQADPPGEPGQEEGRRGEGRDDGGERSKRPSILPPITVKPEPV